MVFLERMLFSSFEAGILRELYTLQDDIPIGPREGTPDYEAKLYQWRKENFKCWCVFQDLADQAGELLTDFLYAGIRADWMAFNSVNAAQFHLVWIMSLFDFSWSKTSQKQMNRCDRTFWYGDKFYDHDEDVFRRILEDQIFNFIAPSVENNEMFEEWSKKCPNHFISEMRDPFTASAKLLESLPFLQRSPEDGPVAPDSFRWVDVVYGELQPIPWRLLNHVWEAENRCASFDGMAEAVWQDMNYVFAEDPLKKAAQKVRKLFKSESIPLDIQVNSGSRTVKIIECP